MQVSLELYLDKWGDEPIANVVCNVVPRVGEQVMLLAGETPESGTYLVNVVQHLLDPRRIETTQHVCVIVSRMAE